MKRRKRNHAFMIGSGNEMSTIVVGALPGMICNRFGEETGKGLL